MPSLDPDVRRLVEAGRQAGKPPFEALTPAQARAAYAASWDLLQAPAPAVGEVRDLSIDGPAGPLALRLYRPAQAEPGEPLPALLFLHGGGWVIGNLDSHDRLCRSLCHLARACVVAVDYRLAPEHPFPAALDDSACAWRWLQAQAAALHIDAGRIGIGGDSAGGNLAAVIALTARDGAFAAPCLQLLLYPVVDAAADDTGSYRTVTGVPLTAATMRWFIGHYAPPAVRGDWRVSPLRRDSLAGLPPTILFTVAHDPLCDEGRAYGRRLEDAGVPLLALHAGDQIHGALMQGRPVRAARTLLEMLGTALRASFEPRA